MALVAGSIGWAAPASAQTTCTWVSGVGDDTFPCSRTAPCKTFAGAISKTADKGEINVIDPGGFGAVNIVKSITIDGAGPHASILAVGTNGVIINGAGVVVTLRNLSINGAGTTVGNGVRVINAAAVNIDNVRIANFAGSTTNGRGISIETSAANVRVTITNTQLWNNNDHQISVNPTSGNVVLDVDNCVISRGNLSGIAMFDNTKASISRCLITNNILGGGVASQDNTVVANVSNSIIANNRFGISNGAATTRLFNTVVTGSTEQGLKLDSGTVSSYGNNGIRGNVGNETPSGALIGPN